MPGPCSYDGCDREKIARGFCDGHYTQYKRGKALSPLDMSKSWLTKVDRPCTFPGCDNLVKTKDLCQAHYTQGRRGVTLQSVRNSISPRKLPPGGAQVFSSEGDKRCSQCLDWLSPTMFHKNKSTSTGLDYSCKGCRARLYDGGGKSRSRGLRRKYGLSVEEYDSILSAQGGVCAICQRPPSETKSLAVDHDHGCCPDEETCGQCIRGLLCFPCNSAIGHFEDNLERLSRAADYIESAKSGKEVCDAGAAP